VLLKKLINFCCKLLISPIKMLPKRKLMPCGNL
jgi:hypothetical protein